MAKALLGKSAYDEAATHFAGEFKRDPGAARAYTAAVYQDMAAASPKQAVQFAQAMGKAGLAEEVQKPEQETAPVQVAEASTGNGVSPTPPKPPQAPAGDAKPQQPAPQAPQQTQTVEPPKTQPQPGQE